METPQNRLAIRWEGGARAQLRGIDRGTALDILHCIDRFLVTHAGDVKKLHGIKLRYRLRCGDYRIFFTPDSAAGIAVTAVLHRREAYR
jgi:mRNA-degrading endonuclease RelE of RelBE toxin-antitoxin system